MILGIVSSPRRGGLTDQLVTGAFEGAELVGIETKKVCLTDFRVPFYIEETNECAEELSRLCEEADSLVVGAPCLTT